jgi:hypothetical protein
LDHGGQKKALPRRSTSDQRRKATTMTDKKTPKEKLQETMERNDRRIAEVPPRMREAASLTPMIRPRVDPSTPGKTRS